MFNFHNVYNFKYRISDSKEINAVPQYFDVDAFMLKGKMFLMKDPNILRINLLLICLHVHSFRATYYVLLTDDTTVTSMGNVSAAFSPWYRGKQWQQSFPWWT